MGLNPREKPPLRLAMEIVTPSGRRYRWSGAEPDPANIPSGLRFSSTVPGGFESLDCELPRKPGLQYQDLERLSTINVYGPGVAKAWEGRLERAPRTSGDKMAVTPSAVGWQAHLDDDKSVRALYVDCDLTKWGPPSVAARIVYLANFGPTDPTIQPDAATGEPAVKTGVTGAWTTAPGRPLSEAVYDAGPGVNIANVYYAWKRGDASNPNNADTNWTWRVLLATDDVYAGGSDLTANLRAAGPGTGTLTATVERHVAAVDLLYANVAAGSDNVEYSIFWTCLAVYGDHGLTKQGTASATEAQGFYASDIVEHAVTTFAPLLNVDGTVFPSSFIIPHQAHLEPTTASEIVRQATRFGLQDWAVWDNRTFWWHERGAVGRKWKARIGPAQLEETGPQVDRLWNSVIVQFQDVDGTTKTAGPPGSGADTEDATLQDDDPSNPANQLGIVRRDMLTTSTNTAAGAVELGARFLEQAKLLDRSGRATFVGHVEDDNGVLHPYWKVRAGDTVEFVDASDTSERRIVRADMNTDTRSCSVDLDSPGEGLQVLLERLGVVLQPLGLS